MTKIVIGEYNGGRKNVKFGHISGSDEALDFHIHVIWY